MCATPPRLFVAQATRSTKCCKSCPRRSLRSVGLCFVHCIWRGFPLGLGPPEKVDRFREQPQLEGLEDHGVLAISTCPPPLSFPFPFPSGSWLLSGSHPKKAKEPHRTSAALRSSVPSQDLPGSSGLLQVHLATQDARREGSAEAEECRGPGRGSGFGGG